VTPKHFTSLIISNLERNTSDSVIITFQIPDEKRQEFIFEAGQYVTLHAVIDGESVRRSYSICSSPSSGRLSVGIKKLDGGKFSTYANQYLKIGDSLDVMRPMGNFIIKNHNLYKRILLIAAGSGITPMMSHIHEIMANHSKIKVDLLYGNRTSASIMFKNELEDVKDKYLDRFFLVNILSKENSGTPLLQGRIDFNKSTRLFNTLLPAQAYDLALICGPQEMILNVKEALIHCGMDSHKIGYELFYASGSTTASANQKTPDNKDIDNSKKAQVTIKLDGEIMNLQLQFDGQNILDAALEAGVDLPFACKSGVCSTCKARVTEGNVDMTINYSLEPDELEAGFVLTCQAHPRTEKVFVDFDQKS
jgi:ring-1,2-phenylacetyl-CoA epoxidase subunit PaaE